MNAINNKPVGYNFTVTDEVGNEQRYSVTEKLVVDKGDYQAEWFDLSGPRRLLLVTCTGKVVNGSYEKNLVVFAEPVL